jgi:hypothetical protein
MTHLSTRILEETKSLPEGAPIAPKALLHLGKRAAVDQALSRLVARGKLLRARRGMYLRPVESRFGTRAPSVEKVVEAMAVQSSETIVSSGAAAANRLGLTSQVPVRQVYLTSGPSRQLHFGKQIVELKHAPPSQLALAGSRAGEVLRALAWVGPKAAKGALRTLQKNLTSEEIRKLKTVASSLPTWLAPLISALPAYAR